MCDNTCELCPAEKIPEPWHLGILNMNSVGNRITSKKATVRQNTVRAMPLWDYVVDVERRLIRNNSDTESTGPNSKNLVYKKAEWKRGWKSHMFQDLEYKVTSIIVVLL